LSDHLVDQLAQRSSAPLHFLVLPSTVDLARRRLQRLEQLNPSLRDRWELHRGDIAAPSLGLDPGTYERLTEEIGVVWHLAAIYDLSVDESVAYKVNVGGTINILDFCQACADLERLNYVSTCYVAGDRSGHVLESELDLGQGHHNHYESTKFWAEVEVQRRWDKIPTAIFRPSVVIGDSRTGATEKYDGPYFVFQLLHRLPEWMPVPNIGEGHARVNLVPIDFVARAMVALGHGQGTENEVYQLADPNPMTARQIVDRVLELMGRNPTRGKLPASWVERALSNRTVEGWTGLPREALTYFNHGAHFDTTNATAALAEADLYCPHLSTYLDDILDFFLRHPDGPPGFKAPQRDAE
jgi:thioester reductase-like protein